MTEGQKLCRGCGKTLPFSAFHRQARGKHGLRARCIECRNLERQAWRQANPEKAREEWTRANRKTSTKKRVAAWRKANPEIVKTARERDYQKHREKRLEGMRRWRKANPEKAKAAETRWRKSNPKRKAALQRAYAARHPERILANLKRWQEQNPDKYRDQVLTKRARRRGARVAEPVILDDLIVRDQGRCGICGKPIMGALHVDHVVPIAAGGTHEPANVQLAHPRCNQRKWAKLDYVVPED